MSQTNVINHSLQINNKELSFSSSDTKENIVAMLGQPDLETGNGCYNVWPDILRYDNFEFHFKNDSLNMISDSISDPLNKLVINFKGI